MLHSSQLIVKGCRQASLVMLLIFLCSFPAIAHTINYAMEKAPANHVIAFYMKLGILHIIPEGFDHILFIAGLCLLSTKLKPILLQATAFTIAHCLTLFLSMKNIVMAPSAVVEPIIALSILFVALENIFFSELKPWRIAVVFMFGLIHGLGFASSLNEIGLPRNKFITSLLSFNGGVEIGQVVIILLMFGLIIIPFGKKPWFRNKVAIPLSIIIACIALYWTIVRVM
ncbi:MAG: HupE/UreJ family protein [Ferruginibacter sp.]